jgi:ABC-type multidrug transport system ATPase subunit/pSer/pThr/pTyr-binding forkhead associated (FHA) protein
MDREGFRLLVVEGPEPGQKIELVEDEMVIGRESAARIVIASPAVSRRHAALRVVDGEVVLEDLGSSNGTFVNGQRVQGSVTLRPGDRIGLGRAIVLTLEGPPPLSATATMLEDDLRLDGLATTIEEGPARPAPVLETVLGGPLDEAPILPQLEVTIAGAPPQLYTLDGARYTLGRAAENNIVISSPIVSRRMAVLERAPAGFRLEVLPDVSNPVFLEGRPVEAPVILHHDDRLRIGGQDPGVLVTLRYLSPSEAVEATPLSVSLAGRERVTIGRDPGNDVKLQSPLVSRFHAQVERVGSRYRITDLRSANGTFVNDQRVSGEAWLQPDDTIRIGSSRFVVGRDALSQFDETGGLQVEVVGLNKWVRKDLNLLKDLSLLFQPREFVVVVGQSGGGKSTLVDAVAGYRPATHGQVLVNGIDVYRNFDAIRNEIGFVPQRDIIHMELTVYQALDYAARLRMPPDTTRVEREKRILEVLEDLDLAHRRDVQISGLSGGQQKRVSIGVELLTSPGLFFLDEPTSGLDPGTETALMQLMRRLADRGRTIILITHATKNVMLADKVVFLARGGHLAWFGPPEEALAYFDQFRSERDRRARAIEFDEIYAILDNPALGTAEEWAKRYRQHSAYQKYVVRPLGRMGHALDGAAPRAAAAAPQAASVPPRPKPVQPAPRRRTRSQVSALRQFFILSARNIRILVRDRPSLVLMLAVGPIIAMLDVVLSFVLGRDLFSYVDGNMGLVVTSLFMPIMYAVMVGALAQMREFVKEADIYKRERLVNLKVLPYVLSKVWVAALLALYQAMVYTAIHYLAFAMPGGVVEFLQVYFTLYLATLAGMMLGLASSALAPNANAAPLIVIMFLVPQFVLGGAMIPVPDAISAPTSARWAFEALMAISGPGSSMAADACWALPKELSDAMSLEDKQANGCRCMGVNALRPDSCVFPGVGKFYDPVLDEAEPPAPAGLGDPPPEPVIPPPPPAPEQGADNVALAEHLLALQEYQAEVEQIQAAFKAQADAYQARADLFAEQAEQFQKDLTRWRLKRNAAVGQAEGMMRTFYEKFSWTFVNKEDPAAYWAKIGRTWISQGIIILVLMTLAILLIWRKDRA